MKPTNPDQENSQSNASLNGEAGVGNVPASPLLRRGSTFGANREDIMRMNDA